MALATMATSGYAPVRRAAKRRRGRVARDAVQCRQIGGGRHGGLSHGDARPETSQPKFGAAR